MDADSLLADGVDFAGLAKAWGNDSRVVQALLKNGTLFEWPSKQTCGIVSFASLAMNYAVVDHLLDIWCCQVTAAKSIYIPHAKEQDARLRMLFEKMAMFWEPSVSKRKKTKAELKEDEDEEKCVPPDDFRLDPSEDLDEHDKATIDAYMSVLQHRSPQAAELDSLSHAAGGDGAFLGPALEGEPSTPVESMRSEILRRQAARACARPLKAKGVRVDTVDTCPSNMSPIAKNLQSKFDETVECLDLLSPAKSAKPASPEALKGLEFEEKQNKPTEPASPEAVKGLELEEKQKPAEPASPKAVKGRECHEKQKPAEPASPEVVKDKAGEDDLFFDASSIRRMDQVQLREDLAAENKVKENHQGMEDEGSDGDVPVMKKPAMRKKQATSTPDPAKPKTKAKAKGKGKAKAKAKAKGTDAECSKPKDAESSMEAPSNEADEELEAELEREMMANGKPDALVEAVEDTRPVPRRRASPEDDDGDQPKPPRKRREGPNKTFAGRIMPKEVFAKQRFESIRNAFDLYCLPRLKKPSTHADAFWKHCFELVGPGKKVDGLALKKICKERAVSSLMGPEQHLLIGDVRGYRCRRRAWFATFCTGFEKTSRIQSEQVVKLEESELESMTDDCLMDLFARVKVEAMDETNALPVKTEVENDLGDWSQDAQPPEPYPMSLDADSFPETQPDGVPRDEGFRAATRTFKGLSFTSPRSTYPGGVKPDQEALSSQASEPTKIPPSPGGVKPDQEALSKAEESKAHDAPEVLSFPPQQLSEGAIDKRLRRVMSPRANGEHLVSGEFVKLWQDRVNGSISSHWFEIFEKFVRRCRLVTETVAEELMEIEGEFLSEDDFETRKFSEQKRQGIRAHCAKHPGLTRESKYNEGTLYWVDTRIHGSLKKSKKTILEEAMEVDMEEDEKMKLPEVGDAWGMLADNEGPGPLSKPPDPAAQVVKKLEATLNDYPADSDGKRPSQEKLKTRLNLMHTQLEALTDEFMEFQYAAVVDGYSHQKQSEIRVKIDEDSYYRLVEYLAQSMGEGATASEEANAERFVKKLFERFDLSIPVEVEAFEIFWFRGSRFVAASSMLLWQE
ncbi:hypothetical protein AK812_SmicGene1172 [Symbiodinium microadriaticum]|uniref:Uncharacterized protein n=1 Tax=Symbiodinium microadriaticum TaxID=2951 RepID=A0A1Q9F4V4_SYMMI|nr:hypothetical protein AK812_SmicGene1172 [Symbiodinium microadriaticum]